VSPRESEAIGVGSRRRNRVALGHEPRRSQAPAASRAASTILPVRIYYEDTDFTGLVYHANYLRYFERGRSDFLRVAGVHHSALLDGAEP
jgi:hypothetical protein